MYIVIIGIAGLIFFAYNNLHKYDDSLVIIPMMTRNAYFSMGFYNYYSGDCDDRCLHVKIVNDRPLREESNEQLVNVLKTAGYNTMTDFDITKELDKNPKFLLKYKKIILLHSEYVTDSFYHAITTHPKVIYLSPNSLYAKVSLDGNVMTLVRGHGYPDKNISNGFDWKYDNTHPPEYDKICKDWSFIKIENGYQINCNPEEQIYNRMEIIKRIGEL